MPMKPKEMEQRILADGYSRARKALISIIFTQKKTVRSRYPFTRKTFQKAQKITF